MIELPILSTSHTSGDITPNYLPAGPSEWHRFDADGRQYIYVSAGSQVYALDGAEFDALVDGGQRGDPLSKLSIPHHRLGPLAPPRSAPIRALSLAVAQKCNLGCLYCYAEGGDFGGAPKAMSLDLAERAVDRMLEQAPRGERVHLSYLGGEPLLARDVVRATTEYAASQAAQRGVSIGFAITTNATLLSADDADFFERHRFAVTVSIDGVGDAHDRQRPFKGGAGSYARVLERVRLLLARPIPVYARATITLTNLQLRETLNGLLAEGFTSVGFSPMLAAPETQAGHRQSLGSTELNELLTQMIACGQEFERRIIAGKNFGFANMVDAMGEIHRGSNRAYPCGAGNGYFGVSADGDLAACHRFVGDEAGRMGSIQSGLDAARQETWLRERFVDHQEPCRSCWARYLCGGGCHHEVLRRGRPACDYIRGWLHYVLQAYARLRAARPDYFAGSGG